MILTANILLIPNSFSPILVFVLLNLTRYRDNLTPLKNQTSFISTIRLNYTYDFESSDSNFLFLTNHFYSIYEHDDIPNETKFVG